MNVNIRKYQVSDYDTLASWWKQAGYNPVPADILPPTTYIGSVDGVDAMAVSVYTTNSSMAIMENFIANPEASAEARAIVLKYGLELISGEMKALGFRYFWGYPNNIATERYYKRLGFTTMQKGILSIARKI